MAGLPWRGNHVIEVTLVWNGDSLSLPFLFIADEMRFNGANALEVERSRVRIHLRIRCSVLSVRRRNKHPHLERATSAWWGLTLGMSWDERGPLFSVVNIFLRWAKSMSLKITLTRLHYCTARVVPFRSCSVRSTGSVAVSRVF
jgi:hypothetical protein